LIYPLLYNGPLNYFARLVREETILLEQHDTYSKQTFRNRCRILGPNGVHTLSIPVRRPGGNRTLYRDIRIDYDSHWNRIHWKSLEAAYAASPYFEYLCDDLRPCYEERFEFLVDLNLRLLEKLLEHLALDIPLELTGSFREITGTNDPRSFIHPKRNLGWADPRYQGPHYHQVFQEKHGFQANLSILDLLFNTGPDSLGILKGSLRT
jgi:hypothetical protein